MTPNDKLPEELQKQIQKQSEEAMSKMDGMIKRGVTEESRGHFLTGYQEGYAEGATAWAPWRVKHDQLEATIDDKIDKALHAERNKIQAKVTASEVTWAKECQSLKDQAQRMADALTGCIGTIIFWYEVLSNTEGFGVMEAEYLEAKNQSIKRIETALQQFKDGKKEVGDEG